MDQGATVAVLQKEEVPLAQGMLCARVVKEESTEVGIAQYVHEMHNLYDHRPDIACSASTPSVPARPLTGTWPSSTA